MKYIKLYSLILAASLFGSCNKDVLDRPPLTTYPDAEFWRNEEDVRMYANSFNTNFFNGYNTGFTLDYAPLRGYTFNDDVTSKNAQASFENSIPSSRGSTAEGAAWMGSYAGPTWDFAWVRKANVLLNRIDTRAKSKMTDEAYKHWTAVAKFFRGFEYSRLVSVFGDVPFYDRIIEDTTAPAVLFKDRDPRGVVMDRLYDDFKYVMANMRDNDGVNNLNRYIAAAFISRFMLFEGTYEHYRNMDAARSKKYLEFAVEAAAYVINSNKFNFGRDFKTLFASESLVGHPEVLLYRVYDQAQSVTHSIASYSNGTEIVGVDANLVLIKSFIANDGKPWQTSAVPNVSSFFIADLIQTRDSRFEASFYNKANNSSATMLYGLKYVPRDVPVQYIGKAYPAAWGSSTNTSDAPVMRLAEVVLNWIEAKAILEQNYGGAAVTQADLDKSINAIRNRPLDATAVAAGVKKTSPLLIAAVPDDPARDVDVPALIWEIRRERRMEFLFEDKRLLDLKRWKKLNYMDFSTNPDYLLGPWVNVPVELPSYVTAIAANIGKTKVKKLDGTIVTFDGTNQSQMVGFWVVENGANRNAFTDKMYLSPVGQAQIVQYQQKGFTLTQTTGW
jgi:hypothetical protein